MKLLATIVFLVFISFHVASQEKGNVETKLMVLPGNVAWKNSGILINSKDKVTISAAGRVFFSDGDNLSGSRVAPKGMSRNEYKTNWFLDFSYCDDPLMLFIHAAFICKIGNEVLPVGLNKTYSGKKGALHIGINDCTFDDKFYNTGKFNVNIKVVREK